MRYAASDKSEIIRLVEQSHWPARRMLDKLGIPRSSFYRWCDRYQRVWSRRCDRHIRVRFRVNHVHNLDEDDDSGQCTVLIFLRTASCCDSRLSRARRKIESLADGLHRTRPDRPLDHS